MKTLDELLQKLDGKKEEQNMFRAFKMDFSYAPTKEKSLIRLSGHTICSAGNFVLFIAPPGSGKSNLCEAITANSANPECDALGFEVDSEKTLLIDTERVKNDLYKGLHRIAKRSGLEQEDLMKKIGVYSFISVESTEDAKRALEHLIATGKYELAVVDGSADFVKSVNDEEESKSFWRWAIALANKYEIGFVFTIHPNPNDSEMKATGHLGSQAQKKAEAVFNVVKSNDGSDIRVITTEMTHGKVRNAKDKITSSFIWSENENMFVSCENKERKKKKKSKHDLSYFFEEKPSYTYNELCRIIREKENVSLSTAKRRIKESEELEEIYLYNAKYHLNNGLTGEEQEEQIEEDNKDEDIPF